VHRGGARGRPRQHGRLGQALPAAARRHGSPPLRQSAGQGARISRRHARGLSWPAAPCPLQRPGRRDRRGPDRRKRDTVLAAVKAWPGSHGDRRAASATAILDGACARCPAARAGRDEETVPRSNKETGQKPTDDRSSSMILRAPGRPPLPNRPARSTPKRTNDVLPKPDIFKSCRQLLLHAAALSGISRLIHCAARSAGDLRGRPRSWPHSGGAVQPSFRANGGTWVRWMTLSRIHTSLGEVTP
jgi:hypothetical protein